LVESNNPKADAFLKIDSLKNEMRFAYSEVRSEASKKLNNKKWFKTFQDFGEQLDEPLAELAIYSYLSDRGGELHNFYLEDLRNNTYYAELRTRLEEEYPNSSYTNQYKNEVEADLFRIEESLNKSSRFSWTALLSVLLFISIGINVIFWVEKKKQKQTKIENLKANLSKQEQVVLELILENKSNKDIAEALFLSVSTVKSHTNNIYKKLDVNSRSDVKSLFSK
jgi:DNA-binding CsgD family transcriptional regulator